MRTVAIVACSNGLKPEFASQNEELFSYFKSIGCRIVLSSCIYEKSEGFSAGAKERADELMRMFNNPDIEEIYDISGGDLANHILDKELILQAILSCKHS